MCVIKISLPSIFLPVVFLKALFSVLYFLSCTLPQSALSSPHFLLTITFMQMILNFFSRSILATLIQVSPTSRLLWDSIPLILHATLVLSLMKILLSLIRSHHFLSPAILICVSSAVSVLTLILKQPVPSLPLLSTLNFKLDYCNSLYYNLRKCQLNRLQVIQNCLTRTVVKAPKSSHITPILRSLHWLKINERIEYKLLSLT